MLTEEQISAFVQRYGKIGVVDWAGHQLIFRKPSREDVRDYRRKQDSPSERPDAVEQLAQVMIVAFDEEQEPVAARAAFLSLLVEFPAFASSHKCVSTLNVLSGIVEDEASADLGKGVSIRSSRQKPTPPASPTGSAG